MQPWSARSDQRSCGGAGDDGFDVTEGKICDVGEFSWGDSAAFRYCCCIGEQGGVVWTSKWEGFVSSTEGGVEVDDGAAVGRLATAASFAASAILTAALVRAPSTTPEGPEESSTGYWSDLREGLRFIRRDPLLRCIIALVLVTNTLDAARSSTLLPLYAERHLDGASSFGIVSGAFGAAALTCRAGSPSPSASSSPPPTEPRRLSVSASRGWPPRLPSAGSPPEP